MPTGPTCRFLKRGVGWDRTVASLGVTPQRGHRDQVWWSPEQRDGAKEQKVPIPRTGQHSQMCWAHCILRKVRSEVGILRKREKTGNCLGKRENGHGGGASKRIGKGRRQREEGLYRLGPQNRVETTLTMVF